MSEDNKTILTESRVFLKAIEVDEGDNYLIGNCNIDIGLDSTTIRIVPPLNEDEHGEAIITNGMYSDKEFEQYMADDLDVPYYFSGRVNMNIRADDTVWKLFRNSHNEHGSLIINKTQRKKISMCSECGFHDGEYHKNGYECPRCGGTGWKYGRPLNPLEVKIFMRKKNLRNL